MTIQKLLNNFKNKYYIIYKENLNNINPSFYFEPEDIHGIMHTKRVMLLSILLLQLLNADINDNIDTLLISSIYHDIGRKKNNIDFMHGYHSWNKMKQNGICSMYENKYNNIFMKNVQFIIENHCIEDNYLNYFLKKYKIVDENRAIFLIHIFKDCDNLDRFRLGDFKKTFLRFKESESLIRIAKIINSIKY